MAKGSRNRVTNRDRYRRSFERIFGPKPAKNRLFGPRIRRKGPPK